MNERLRLVLFAFFAVAVGFASGCKVAPEESPRIKSMDASLDKAVSYLLAAQSPDGAWRSKTYGAMKDGPSLTPLVMEALEFGPQKEGSAEACHKGAAYLAGLVKPDGSVEAGPYGLAYPLYTSAMSAIILTKDASPEFKSARDTWLKMLRSRQLTEELGWQPSDHEYGGWGFSIAPPAKPAPGQPKEIFHESNLSATIFAIGALRACGAPPTDEAFQKALVFVKRCQNFGDEKAMSVFDDGGFFFIPIDEAQNKGGLAGREPDGTLRFNSYGSMTADGIRALVRLGMKPDSPRVKAAAEWLANNFSVEHNPGRFGGPDREVLRDATYYYYCWSLAHALNALNIDEIDTPSGKVRWAGVLADALTKRQQADGSWVNRMTDAKEDDPLISTAWAVAALSICRQRELASAPSRPNAK
jgi:squalene-hopene/tetraprenyl-beta-curcumene cyclase